MVGLINDDRNFKQKLIVIHNALKSICTEVSKPIFSSPDARDFAVFVRAEISAQQIFLSITKGCVATNEDPAIITGDKLLVVNVGDEQASIGFSGILKFLAVIHRKSGF